MKISGIYKIQSKIKPERIYIGDETRIKISNSLHKYHLDKKRLSNERS
jgi:hypothetical protein